MHGQKTVAQFHYGVEMQIAEPGDGVRINNDAITNDARTLGAGAREVDVAEREMPDGGSDIRRWTLDRV